MKPKIEALLKQINSGKRLTDKARILKFVIKNPYCSTVDVEVKLNMLHQTASARISDLLDDGILEEKGQKETTTSKFTYLKYQPDLAKQSENAKNRKREKFENWLNKGKTQFKEFINPQLKHELECIQ